MSINSFFAENPLSPTTRLLYTRAISQFLERYDPETCTAGDILDFLDKKTTWGNSIRYTASVAIKRYLRWKFGDSHPALRMRIKREDAMPGRSLDIERAAKLLASFNTSKMTGVRNLAIACLAMDNGLRVSELARLKFSDVDLIHRKLVVRIKGGKPKDATFSTYTASCIAAWAPYRRIGDDRLFQMTRDGLRVTVRRWGEKLGFTMSPHDLRRTFATISSQSGAPSRLLQVAGRWSSIEMVERYTASITPEDFEDYFPVNRVIRY